MQRPAGSEEAEPYARNVDLYEQQQIPEMVQMGVEAAL